MSNSIGKNIILVLGVLCFQLIVLNQINLSQSLLPLVYPIIILSLPRNINKSLLLGIGFGLGLLVDMFMNTGGANAIACTLLAFFRTFFLSSMAPSDMGSESIKPSVINMGFKNYSAYVFLLMAIHHLAFFFLEVFTFDGTLWTLSRAILSLIFSTILILVYQYLFISKTK